MLIVRLMNAHPSIPNRHAGVNAYVRCGQAALFPALAQDTARKHGKHLRILNGDLAVDRHAFDAVANRFVLLVGGVVMQLLQIDHQNVCLLALGQNAAIRKPQLSRRHAAHLVDGLLQREQMFLLNVLLQNAHAAAIVARMALLLRRETVGTDHGIGVGNRTGNILRINEEHDHHEHHHHHGEECGCGHGHHHEHHHEHEHHHDGECGCGCGHNHDHEHHHHHHADEVFTSWGKETPKKYNKEELDTILQKLSKDDSYGMILRSKGILQTEDGSWIQFDLVPGEYEIREGSADYTGRICVIGSKLKEDELEGLFF